MDFPKWAKDDGEKLANLIYEKLVEKGTLEMYEIFDIYDTCGLDVLKKTEGVAWGILNPKIERTKNEDNRFIIKLKQE